MCADLTPSESTLFTGVLSLSSTTQVVSSNITMFPFPVGKNRLTNKLQNKNIYGISYICSREKELLPWRHGITFLNKVFIPEVIKLTAIVQINFKMLII